VSVTLWIDTDADETVELGPTLLTYKAFAELKRAAGPRWETDYPDLAGVLTQCETQEDADPRWLIGVRRQAAALLRTAGARLSPDARDLAETLASAGSSPTPDPEEAADALNLAHADAASGLRDADRPEVAGASPDPASQPDHPSSGKTAAQIRDDLVNYHAGTMGKYGLNPRGYDRDNYPPGVDGPAVSNAVVTAVKAAKAKSSFAQPTIKDLYPAAREASPGLTVHQFHGVLAKMYKDRQIWLRPHTLAASTIRDEDVWYMMPLDAERKWFVDDLA
jgi:hypothetical protein